MHGVEADEFLKQLSPLNRLAEIAEVVDLVLFLESAPFINGEVIHLERRSACRQVVMTNQ